MGQSFPLTNIFQDGWNHQPEKYRIESQTICEMECRLQQVVTQEATGSALAQAVWRTLTAGGDATIFERETNPTMWPPPVMWTLV